MTIKDQICAATDALRTARIAYMQAGPQGKSEAERDELYTALRAAGEQLLRLRQQAEQKFSGKIKTKITPTTISNIIR